MTEFLASLPLRWLIYKQRRAQAPAAVLSYDTHRITGKWRCWVRPLSQRAYREVPAAVADMVQRIPTEAEVCALIGAPQ